ncbi:MAG TPA: hypothetical protein DDW45_05175 [Gammaproteobacteria bacterium]|nr:hypothetical protein [Gammaproteobacteria bacterium]
MMIRSLLFLVTLLSSTIAISEWYSLPKTTQGQELRYDNSTNRVEVVNDTGNRPLWSGVHKLEDGRVLRIQKGVAIADQTVQHAIPSPQIQPDQVDACTVLERQSCGLRTDCGLSESCQLAHQLQGFYNSATPSDRTKIESQCKEAINNKSMFPPCPTPPTGAYRTVCGDIVIKSCGKFNQCKESEACGAAHQLVSMESEERLNKWVPSEDTYTTRQCKKAYGDDKFFPLCEKKQ